MQNTCEMPGWMTHKLGLWERNINNLRYAYDTCNGGKQRGAKEPPSGVKDESEKVNLKLNI